MEHIAINGLDIAVEVVGTGPPLVLLHGILVDSRAWRPQLDHLRDEFTVVAWDAPGCGRSVDPHETWRFPEYADCLAELMAALRLTTRSSVDSRGAGPWPSRSSTSTLVSRRR